MAAPDFSKLRERMVRDQLEARHIRDPRVLAAMRAIPRHAFVSDELQRHAYEDRPLPIGLSQTISQPYIVAYMVECLRLTGHETVLEIGTGSGYQAAILARLAAHVISIERHALLAQRATQVLAALDCVNAEVREGDGSQGLPELAPFEAIIVSAAAPAIPEPLVAQLADGGRLVLPVGNNLRQYLSRVTRSGDASTIETLLQVMFVPLLGQYGFDPTP